MNCAPWRWTLWALSTRRRRPESLCPHFLIPPPRADAGAGWFPPRLAIVAAGNHRRRAPWHAPPPTRGFSKRAAESPLVHPPVAASRAPALSTCLQRYNATTCKNLAADGRCAGTISGSRAPLNPVETGPLPAVHLSGVACPACLLVYMATIRQRANARLRKTPRHRAPSLLTARPFGAKVLLVDNERISLPANPETLAVAQSRSPEPSNARSRQLRNPASLHLSLSRILGRSNAHNRQVDMYTNPVLSESPMLQPVL